MTETTAGVVIVGAGLAGAKTAEALRAQNYAGPVTLIGDETELPYERPPLSKGYLAGKDGFDKAVVHPESWYAENGVELVRGIAVTAIDRAGRAVELADGRRVPYETLVLATGAEPRRLPLPGAESALTLRTHADAFHTRAVKTSGATTREAALRISQKQQYSEWHESEFQDAVLERMRARALSAGRRFGTGPGAFSWLAEVNG